MLMQSLWSFERSSFPTLTSPFLGGTGRDYGLFTGLKDTMTETYMAVMSLNITGLLQYWSQLPTPRAVHAWSFSTNLWANTGLLCIGLILAGSICRWLEYRAYSSPDLAEPRSK